jgi:thioredoxin reductase (NADPH)
MADHRGHGVSGPELMELMRQQAVNFGTRIVTDDVVSVEFSKHPFRLKTLEGKQIEALSVIVATGARANYLGLPSEDKFKNAGVSACAVCDGEPRFSKNAEVCLRGGRQCHGRGGLPHEIRQQGFYYPPA